ncbi:MAG: hypothetical protein LBS32_05255 [Clostridiales Family XIII bacterium]|jgi:hypothetical protein|nr:hypothetical protein [Clostridiales Family XIII bacterium]
MSVTEQIDYLLGQLPDSEKYLLLEIIKRFVPDDLATPDDLEAIQNAHGEWKRGETIGHDKINWRQPQ